MRSERLKNILFTAAFPALMFVVMDVIVSLATQRHLIETVLDIKSILRNTGISAMIAFALSFNLPSGRFDFSLGAQRLAGTIIGGLVALNLNLSGIWVMVFAILFGALFGFLTGTVFVMLRLPAMVLGIGMGLILEVIPYVVSGGKGLNLFGKEGMSILSDTGFIIGTVVVVGVIVMLIMNRTVFGYHLRAIQGSQQISQNSGIDIFRHTVLCYTLAGALVCIAGVISVSYSTSMEASTGLTSINVITANIFPMVLGNYLGRRSNSSVGIIVAAFTLKIFSYGLTLLEFSEANSSVMNMLLFIAFLVFLANEHSGEKRKSELKRIHEAKMQMEKMNLA